MTDVLAIDRQNRRQGHTEKPTRLADLDDIAIGQGTSMATRGLKTQKQIHLQSLQKTLARTLIVDFWPSPYLDCETVSC